MSKKNIIKKEEKKQEISPQALAIKQNIKQFEEIRHAVLSALKEGPDYGKVRGIAKPFLFKGGAEKILIYYNLKTEYQLEKQNIDYENKIVAYTFTCKILNKLGEVLQVGYGTCSNIERAKRNMDFGTALHNCMLIAKKRAMINGVIPIGGFGAEFTQDEDLVAAELEKEKKGGGKNHKTSPTSPSLKTQPKREIINIDFSNEKEVNKAIEEETSKIVTEVKKEEKKENKKVHNDDLWAELMEDKEYE